MRTIQSTNPRLTINLAISAAFCLACFLPEFNIIVVPIMSFVAAAALILLGTMALALPLFGRRKDQGQPADPGRGKDSDPGWSRPDYATVAAGIDQIEQEMRRAGLWQDAPLSPEQYQFSRAFGMDTMAYSQWLQFIFIPRVRQIIETRGQFPASSSVGAQAVREFDTVPNAERLTTLLCEFDRLFS